MAGFERREWGERRRIYLAAVAGVDAVDEVDGVVVLVGFPRDDLVAVLFHGGDDCFDTADNRRVREYLDSVRAGWNVLLMIRVRYHRSCRSRG